MATALLTEELNPMTNRFDRKGFAPAAKRSAKQSNTVQTSNQPPTEGIPTSTCTVVQAALTSSAAHLQQLEEGMDLVSDQFADRAVFVPCL